MYGPTDSPPAYYQPQPPAQPRPVDGLAIASLVLGILWITWLGSILAVVFGHISIHKARQAQMKPSGLAIAGLVLGYIGLGFLVLVIFVAVLSAAGSGN